MKYWDYIVRQWEITVFFLAILLFSACLPKKHATDAFIYPDSGGPPAAIKEVDTPSLITDVAAPPSVKSEKKGEFIPPPLSPQFTREEAEAAQKRGKKVDEKFVYKDKELKELLTTFPFIKIKKLRRLEYLEHDIAMIKETLFAHPTTVKHFIALNALKESYLYYTKKNKMYRKIAKKLSKGEQVSSKQSRFVEAVNSMYSILRDVLINEGADYRLKMNAIRYMESMRGKVIMDFFVEDALEDIASSKDAPPSLVAKAKEILEKNGK